MTCTGHRSRIVLCFYGVLAVLMIQPATAQSQEESSTEPGIIYACYIPQSGVVYRVGEPGLRAETQECVSENHVLFSWNEKGEKGEPGPQGPPGSGSGNVCRVESLLTLLAAETAPHSTYRSLYVTSPQCLDAGPVTVTGATLEVVYRTSGDATSYFAVSGTGPPGLPVEIYVRSDFLDCDFSARLREFFGLLAVSGSTSTIIAPDGTFALSFNVAPLDYSDRSGPYWVGWNGGDAPIACSDPFFFDVNG